MMRELTTLVVLTAAAACELCPEDTTLLTGTIDAYEWISSRPSKDRCMATVKSTEHPESALATYTWKNGQLQSIRDGNGHVVRHRAEFFSPLMQQDIKELYNQACRRENQ